jgi:hypothetical protein
MKVYKTEKEVLKVLSWAGYHTFVEVRLAKPATATTPPEFWVAPTKGNESAMGVLAILLANSNARMVPR